ncbi:hypothetical protein BCR42DRAFT_407614 [Absidia repens]|uniref:Uncharacterized protein n=1 Tax=Absidia repens TaxID=90262 RepID=A0A1X2ISF7_9FUNG|nr:hypothetical protein BCR42DRAFT_407614 [Absidia repens]
MLSVDQSIQGCPLCSSSIEEKYINMDTKMTMCENIKCLYPFNTTNASRFLKKVPHLLDSNDSSIAFKGKRQARHPLDEAVRSGNGKRQKIANFLTSPIKQTKNSLILALPSEPTSSGTLQLTSTSASETQDMIASKDCGSPNVSMEAMYTDQFDCILEDLVHTQQPSTTEHFSLGDIERFLQDDMEPVLPTSEGDIIDLAHPMAWLDEMVQDQNDTGIVTKLDNEVLSIATEDAFDLIDPLVWLDNIYEHHIKKERSHSIDNNSENESVIGTPKEDAMDTLEPVVWLNDMLQDDDINTMDVKCNPLQSNHELDSLLGFSLE